MHRFSGCVSAFADTVQAGDTLILSGRKFRRVESVEFPTDDTVKFVFTTGLTLWVWGSAEMVVAV